MGGFPFFDKTKRAGRCLFGAYYPRQNKEWRTSLWQPLPKIPSWAISWTSHHTIVGDILDIAPETAPAFIDIGMHCLGCPASRNETVEQACLVHDQPVEELVEKLNAIIVANRK